MSSQLLLGSVHAVGIPNTLRVPRTFTCTHFAYIPFIFVFPNYLYLLLNSLSTALFALSLAVFAPLSFMILVILCRSYYFDMLLLFLFCSLFRLVCTNSSMYLNRQ